MIEEPQPPLAAQPPVDAQPVPPQTPAKPDAAAVALGIKPEQIGNPLAQRPESILPSAAELKARQEEMAAVQKIIDAANAVDPLDPAVHKPIREMLSFFARTGGARNLINQRMIDLRNQAEAGSISQEAYTREERYLEKIGAELAKREKELNMQLDTVRDNPDLPIESRAYVYDMRKHMLGPETRRIAAQKEQYIDLMTTTKDPDTLLKIKAKIAERDASAAKIDQQRTSLENARKQMINEAHAKDANSPVEIPDQLAVQMEVFFKNLHIIAETPFGISQQEAIAQDPLGQLENTLYQAGMSKDLVPRLQIAKALGLVGKEATEFAKMLSVKDLEDKLQLSDWQSRAKQGFIGSIFLMFLFGYLAKKRNSAGGGGGEMMG